MYRASSGLPWASANALSLPGGALAQPTSAASTCSNRLRDRRRIAGQDPKDFDGAGNSDGCLARRRDTTVPLGTTLSETTCWRGLLWQVLALSPGTALRCSRSRPSRPRDACASEDQDLHLQGHLSALHCRRPRVHRCWWPFRPQGHPSGGQSGQRRAYIYVTSSHVVVLQLKVVAVVRRTPVLEN